MTRLHTCTNPPPLDHRSSSDHRSSLLTAVSISHGKGRFLFGSSPGHPRLLHHQGSRNHGSRPQSQGESHQSQWLVHSFLRDRFEAPRRLQIATPCRLTQRHQQQANLSGAAYGEEQRPARAAQTWCIPCCKQHLCSIGSALPWWLPVLIWACLGLSPSMETLPGCTHAHHSGDPVPLLKAFVLPALHQHRQVLLACKAPVIFEP